MALSVLRSNGEVAAKRRALGLQKVLCLSFLISFDHFHSRNGDYVKTPDPVYASMSTITACGCSLKRFCFV